MGTRGFIFVLSIYRFAGDYSFVVLLARRRDSGQPRGAGTSPGEFVLLYPYLIFLQSNNIRWKTTVFLLLIHLAG